ncbi:MAG: prenyltransferase, partial [Muribaculaceae bacterium]|nr:prenyltransferase [Muribaculaceae bacterium]
ITPRAMLAATLATLATACAVGCTLIAFGGWWLLPAGIAIALGALAYSAGPYPLSRHCLGEVAVIVFFGIAPVCLTYYIQVGTVTASVVAGSIAIGLLGAMVLITNNYRDIDEDRITGKHTLATRFGRKAMARLYFVCGIVAATLLHPLSVAKIIPLALGFAGYNMLRRDNLTSQRCIKLLAITSLATLATALLIPLKI